MAKIDPALAPIAIFLENRIDLTERLFAGLHRNPEFAHSPITIYPLGPKIPGGPSRTARTVARELAPAHAVIVEQNAKDRCLEGRSRQLELHERSIFLHGATCASPALLSWFNTALDRYHGEERVMEISGLPLDTFGDARNSLGKCYFWREPCASVSATWRRAWQHFSHDGPALIAALKANPERLRTFTIDGYESGRNYRHTMRNLEPLCPGMPVDWETCWYASMVLAGGLTLYPDAALADTHENLGETVAPYEKMDLGRWGMLLVPPRKFPAEAAEDPEITRRLTKYCRAGKLWGATPEEKSEILAWERLRGVFFDDRIHERRPTSSRIAGFLRAMPAIFKKRVR
jgi:hypothetical protein